MPSPFNPKFVDLVRNFTTTTGTGNFAIGAAVPGHGSLASALAVGDRFFYCVQGIDKPAEREVGRGTMAAGGTVAREPIGGAATNFSAGTKTIALIVAADWFTNLSNWINGGGDTLAALTTSDKSSLVAAVNEVAGVAAAGGGGGTGAGVGLLFSGAAGAAVAATTLALSTAGYASGGRGAARYIYDAAVNAAYVAANPRTAFLAAGGRGFRLDPEQRLTIEMFGGRGDWNGTTGTDNYAAMKAAHEFAPALAGYSPTIHYGPGQYYCGQTLEPYAQFHLRGPNKGDYAGDTASYVPCRLVFPTNTTCIIVKTGLTLGAGLEATPYAHPGATGSIIEGVCIEQATMGTNLAAHGVHMRGTAIVTNCEFNRIAGNAIHIYATAGGAAAVNGNANDWRINNCDVAQCGGDALHVDGQDANAGVCNGFVTRNAVGGCGVFDYAANVNTYIGLQITGYLNTGVQYAGRMWQPLLTSTNVAPGSDATKWYDRGALASPNATFPAWSSSATYLARGPIISGNFAVFVAPYIEGGGAYGYSHAPRGTVLGVDMGWTEYTPVLATDGGGSVTAKGGIGFSRSTGGDTSHPAYAAIGTGEFTLVGAPDPTAAATDRSKRRALIHHRMNNYNWSWRYYGEDQLAGYSNQASNFYITGPATTMTFGRSVAQPYRLMLNRPVIGNEGIGDKGRMFDYIVGGAAGLSGIGEHARGDIALDGYHRSTYPAALHVCTVAGNPGTWRTIASATGKGATGSRPSEVDAINVGVMYLDTTLAAAGKPIWWTGTAWVDATGATV